MSNIQKEISKVIDGFITGERVNLNDGIITQSFDEDGQENECVISINKDLTVDIDYNYEVTESACKLSELPLNIQIAILEALENGDFEEA